MAGRKLYDELRAANSGLAGQLDKICEAAADIWRDQNLREFTVHSGLHYEQVERNLDHLTRTLQSGPRPLTEHEIFVLIAACHLHDIGMQLGVPDARARHAEYAHELIVNSSVQFDVGVRKVTLPINDRNARLAIAQIARAHWTEFALQLSEHEFINDANEKGRLKLLGLLLAMADLLDTSAIRAGYFRSDHRLFDLNPISEVHQTMHDHVCGYQIVPKDAGVPDALRFELDWHDRTDVVRMMSDWQLRWFSSQWRQLMPELDRLSGGKVRWTNPWAHVRFRRPVGPLPVLSQKARRVLMADHAAQRRMDRDQFVAGFRKSLEDPGASLFQLPAGSSADCRELTQWAEAHGRTIDDCLVARLDVAPGTPTDVASLVAEALEQWGEHLHKCDDNEAVQKLEEFVANSSFRAVLLLVITQAYERRLLDPLISTVMASSGGTITSRSCLVVCVGSKGPSRMPAVTRHKVDLAAMAADDVTSYLTARYGYGAKESRQLADKMQALGLLSTPARIYTYIEQHCDQAAWSTEFV